MQVVLTEGCICDSLTVDGVEEIDLTNEQRLKVIDHIYEWMKKHPENLNNILQDMVSTFYNNYESSDHACECCGDYVTTFTWDI